MQAHSIKKRVRNPAQFLETPQEPQKNLQQKERLSQDIKSKYIEELEQRNRKLKYEIIKINEILEEQKEKTTTTKKQYKLIPIESSVEVLKKELENVYKQIKNYEREISLLEGKQAGGLSSDKMARLENILKEKMQHLDKIKGELSVLNKESLENAKKLKNNAGKEQLESQMQKYNEEIKVLREKVRQSENREKMKIENAKKQQKYIANLENQLIQNNVAPQQLQQIKRNNIFIQIYNRIQKSAEKGEKGTSGAKSVVRSLDPKDREEIEEVMTFQRYKELQNEVKLYKKLQTDYDKRLDILEKEKVQEEKQTATIKAKLDEKQVEILKLQEQIGELKSKIKKVNMKPNYSIRSIESQEKKQKDQKKVSPPKFKLSVSKTSEEAVPTKFDQKGQATQKGTRFTDRSLLGKSNDIKITGVRVWTSKKSLHLVGIQCTYKIDNVTKQGSEYISSEMKANSTENNMELADGDYIKLISGHLSESNIVEYLIFISKNNVIGRMGVTKTENKQFNYDIEEDEVPICMYGSMLNGKVEGSLFENLGFEICKDKNVAKDAKDAKEDKNI